MIDKTIYSIFRKGSRTYYYSSLFFPKEIRRDVFSLYSFVRTADDYVDSVPQKRDEFHRFRKLYEAGMEGEETGDIVVDSFTELAERKGFDPSWTESFLGSMEMDLDGRVYQTMAEVSEYTYGSAEVVGLCMAKILDLPKESYASARNLGKAMQYMNFVRDVSEDLAMGRSYFPKEDFEACGLVSLEESYCRRHEAGFRRFIKLQISHYNEWQKSAEEGFRYIPKRCLIPVKTASEMYKWTGKKIAEDPFIIYSRKVKPSMPRIVANIGINAVAVSMAQR